MAVPCVGLQAPTLSWNLPSVEDKWKCDGCSLRWEMSLIKCGACEAYRPGLSDADIAAMKAEEEQKKEAAIAMFRSPAAAAQTGFGFSAAPAPTGCGARGVAPSEGPVATRRGSRGRGGTARAAAAVVGPGGRGEGEMLSSMKSFKYKRKWK